MRRETIVSNGDSGQSSGGGDSRPVPVAESKRITSLDLIRGVSVLGILLMNAVHFKFGIVPYLNISAGGSETWLDWTVAVFGEIFIDQKFMGLFSLLFGAGVMLFIERAAARGGRAVLLNLWRNALLLLIGFLHMSLWEGDILVVYAISSLFLVAMRNLASRTLVVIGAVLFLVPVASDILLQSIANATDATLAGVWTAPGAEIDDTDGLLALGSLFNYGMRGLGMIIMGAGLYRLGFMNGDMSSSTYRRVAIVGAGIGLPLAALGVVFVAVNDFSNGVAFIGNTPNNLGVIPASLGYMSLIILWNQRPDNWMKRRLRSVGRMALTNYLTQTVLGVLILTVLLGDATVNRSGVLLFVLAVWALQFWWSETWLARFRFGPAEWLWRVATYRRWQPIRRA